MTVPVAIARPAAVLALLVLAAAPCLAESPDEFLLEPEGDAELHALALEARTSSVFASGWLSGPDDGPEDAVVVAFDSRTRAERWRYRREEAERPSWFATVDANAGLVCAAGAVTTGLRANHLLVACLREDTGALLWERELAPPGPYVGRIVLELSGRTLVVRTVIPVFGSSPLPGPTPPIPPILPIPIDPSPIDPAPVPLASSIETEVLGFDALTGDGAGPGFCPWSVPSGGSAGAGE